MNTQEYDVAVIGSGPSGYPCALRSQELGLKSCLIEKEMIGGTCLNVGCIPSKTLLYGTDLLENIKHLSSIYGIALGSAKILLEDLMKKKLEVVKNLSVGLDAAFKGEKIDRYQGSASFTHENAIQVISRDGIIQTIHAKNFVIATGSSPIELPFLPFDEKSIVSSTGALSLQKIPETLAVIGGGVIGCELASVWARLGSKVTIVELLPSICSGIEPSISRMLESTLRKQGIEIHTKTKVVSANKNGKKHTLIIQKEGKEQEEISCDVVLVAVGRRPNTKGLGLDTAQVEVLHSGFIQVDSNFRTTNPHIYAVGDVIGGPMLAHKGWQEGFCVAQHIKGLPAEMLYITVPNVIYTSPEVASVGLTSIEAKEMGFDIIIGDSHMKGNPRAKASSHDEGQVVVIACAKSHIILGLHLIGPYVSEMISFGMLALQKKATLDDVVALPFAHPTYAESIREACFHALGIKVV